MTPKEKAVELVHEMWGYCSRKEQAKQCALIAVDEILEATKRNTYNQHNWDEITGFGYSKYWIEVKEEIKKL